MSKSGQLILPPGNIERLKWEPVWTREIFGDVKSMYHLRRDIRRGRTADDRLIVPGNILLTTGITQMLKLLATSGATQYNTGAYIAVGNGNTAESAAHTDLQGASKQRNAMEATFPTVSSATVTWKSSYATGEANFNWLEAGVQNASAAPNGSTIFMLNRKQADFGTKVSSAVWTMTLAITVS